MIMKNFFVFICVLLISSCISTAYCEEECLKKAWAALDAKKYELAIEYADECINEFGKVALKIQSKLEKKKIPEPPIGAVNAAEKKVIFARGLLNDVSAACFIKGKAAEKLYGNDKKKNEEYKKIANEAYKLTCKYKFGRVWDPKGWFWSPCEAAELRMPVE